MMPNQLYRAVHVEGRTPGPRGMAPMVTVQDGAESDIVEVGSHHEAVYIAAIIALAEALRNGEEGLVVTSPSDHLVEQMNKRWKVGDELRGYHAILRPLAGMFRGGVTWKKAPRSDN